VTVAPAYIVLIAALAVAAMLWSEARAPRLEWLFKPLASLCFVLLALQAGALESVYGRILLIGLLLCMAGDVLLIPSNDRSFLAGLSSFLLGHLAYAAAFFQLPWRASALLASLLPVAVLAVLSVRWLWPQLPDRMRLPVVAYIAVICSMLLTAGAAWGSAAGVWILVGAWGFAVSDLSVARNQFVSPGMVNRIWGIPLYFGSQLLLAWSVQFA
jgi:uncharacterized membrane protein YhhN